MKALKPLNHINIPVNSFKYFVLALILKSLRFVFRNHRSFLCMNRQWFFILGVIHRVCFLSNPLPEEE